MNLPRSASFLRVGFLFLAALLAWVLPARAEPTEAAVVVALTTEAVRPAFATLADTARRLSGAVDQLCQRGDAESLRQARAAWQEAYLAWRRCGPFLFGPAARLDQYLGKVANGVVLDAAVTDAAYAHLRKNPDMRGYAGLEHLLFAPADAAKATAGERCAHMADVAGEIAERTAQARQEWDGAYGAAFLAAGDGKPFLIPGDALSLALAAGLNTTEHLLRDQVSIPSGYFEGAAKPEYLPAWRSNMSCEAFRASLEGLRALLTGQGETSLAGLVAVKDGLVSKKDPALAAALRRQLEQVGKDIAALGAKGRPLRDELQRNPKMLKDLYDSLAKLQEQMIELSLVLELDVRSPAEKAG